MPLQVLHELGDFLEFPWNLNALGAMRLALSTSNAVVSLSHFGNSAVESDKVFPAPFPIFLLEVLHWQTPFVLTLVVVHKNARYINTVCIIFRKPVYMPGPYSFPRSVSSFICPSGLLPRS